MVVDGDGDDAEEEVLDDAQFTSLLHSLIGRKYFPDLPQQLSEHSVPSLTRFFAKYRSEDDESFNRLMRQADQIHQSKHPHLYPPQLSASQQQQNSSKKLTLLHSAAADSHSAKNSLFFTPQNLNRTGETGSGFKKPRNLPLLVPANTRISRKASDECRQEQSRRAFKTFYAMLNEPSPKPGLDLTPLITYGEFLDSADETPTNLAQRFGNTDFKVQELSRNEVIADNLRRNATLSKTPVISRHGSSRRKTFEDLSPSAKKIASNLFNLNSTSTSFLSKSHFTPKTPKSSRGKAKTPDGRPRRLKAKHFFESLRDESGFE